MAKIKLELKKAAEFSGYPVGFLPDSDMNLYNFAIHYNDEEAGVTSLRRISPTTAIVSIFIKPEYRGKVFGKEFWNHFYTYTFLGLELDLIIAHLDEKRLSPLLKRVGWQEDNGYLYVTKKEIYNE